MPPSATRTCCSSATTTTSTTASPTSRAPRKNNQTAPLAAFGWGPGDPIRTLCEYNLNALEWPDGQPDPEGWIAAWSQAFDVEKVTRRFYEDYAAVFEKVEKLIGNTYPAHSVCGSGTRSVPDTAIRRR